MKVYPSLLIIIVFIFSFTVTPFMAQHFKVVDLTEPELGFYRGDELSFLKTFYLMKDGMDYYQSFKLAREGLIGDVTLSTDIFTWRSPAVFIIWSYLAPNGMGILTLFVFLGILTSIAVFFLIRRISNPIVGFISLLMFLLFTMDAFVHGSSFLFTEWWGMFLFLIGLSALFSRLNKLAALCFALAVLIREIFILPVGLYLLYSLLFDRKRSWVFITSAAVFCVFCVLHNVYISQAVNESTKAVFFQRFHGYDLANLQKFVSFSMRNFVVLGQKTHYLIFFLGVISPLFMFIKDKQQRGLLAYLIMPIALFTALLPLISVPENDYWGILFMPLVVISSPLLLSFLKLKK